MMLYNEEHVANDHPGGLHPTVIDDEVDQGRYTRSTRSSSNNPSLADIEGFYVKC